MWKILPEKTRKMPKIPTMNPKILPKVASCIPAGPKKPAIGVEPVRYGQTAFCGAEKTERSTLKETAGYIANAWAPVLFALDRAYCYNGG